MSEITEKLLENLQSEDRRIRLTALKSLQKLCESTKDMKIIITTFDNCYLHMLNCYADKYESCREQAILTVGSFVQFLPTNDFYLQNVISTMSSRMGKVETIEDSEEIRLLHINQLNNLIDKYKKTETSDYLAQCYDEIINIIHKTLSDPYPAVQKDTCTCIVKLSKATNVFHVRAEHLALPLFKMLNHKHSQNRIAAIEACYMLALHINPNSEMLVRIFYETSPLLMDSMPNVRRECGRMGCLMLMDLKDRYSFFERIIPLVLCCLKDESPDVREFILPLWKQCGKQYFNENEEELQKIEIGEKISENYPSWENRPTIGCRALVQRSLRLLIPIMKESYDWKENVRLHALKLLYQFVLHAEAAMTAKFFEIYPDLAKACADQESNVANEAMKAADLMGRLLSYSDWKDHGIEGLQKNPRLGHLRCLYHLFASTPQANGEDVVRISEILIGKEFSQNLNPDFQLYVLRLIEDLWLKRSSQSLAETMAKLSVENSDFLERNLYAVAVRVMALSFAVDGDTNHVKLGEEFLDKIATTTNTDISQLHCKHLTWVLSEMDDLDAFIDSLSEPILLFAGVIQLCGFRASSLEAMKKNIRTVWDNATDDAKVKILTSISVAMLKWSETIGLDSEDSEDELRKFTKELIEEHIQWRVGSASESLRSLAVATLCSMTQGAPDEAPQILPTLVKYFTNLLEDNALTTRNYALRCLLNFGEVETEELRPIALNVLQRLDDPHSGIRELAAMVIPKLNPICPTPNDHVSWNAYIKKALTSLFLYFDGPEVKLRDVIRDALIELGTMYPDVFEEPLNCALATSFQKKAVEEIKNAVYNS